MHGLTNELARLSTQLVGQTNSFTINSQHFVEQMHTIKVEENDQWVSFDVVSLFTRGLVKIIVAFPGCLQHTLASFGSDYCKN